MDPIENTEPIENAEFTEPILQNEFTDPMLRIEPRDPMLFTLRVVRSGACERWEEDMVLELMFSAYRLPPPRLANTSLSYHPNSTENGTEKAEAATHHG